jgi:hypothetical protein
MDQKQSPLLLSYERTYQFTNSGSTYRADNVSKNRFTIQLSRPITVPPHAKNVMMKCLYASIWNTSPNITVTQTFRIEKIGGTTYAITVPVGLYGVQDIQDLLSRGLESNGLPDDYIELIPNYATQKVIFVFKDTSTLIRFDDNQTSQLRTLLGFDARTIGPVSAAYGQVEGDSVAQFNQINSFHVGTTLLNGGGIRINDNESSTAAIIPINSAPGSQILFSPFNPISLSADHLIGNMINTVKFWITDEKQRDVIMNEPFEILFSITFLAKPQD